MAKIHLHKELLEYHIDIQPYIKYDLFSHSDSYLTTECDLLRVYNEETEIITEIFYDRGQYYINERNWKLE